MTTCHSNGDLCLAVLRLLRDLMGRRPQRLDFEPRESLRNFAQQRDQHSHPDRAGKRQAERGVSLIQIRWCERFSRLTPSVRSERRPRGDRFGFSIGLRLGSQRQKSRQSWPGATTPWRTPRTGLRISHRLRRRSRLSPQRSATSSGQLSRYRPTFYMGRPSARSCPSCNTISSTASTG